MSAAITNESRLQFLEEASNSLIDSLDSETTFQIATRLAIPQLADWAILDVLDSKGSIRRVSVAHLDPNQELLAGRIRRLAPHHAESANIDEKLAALFKEAGAYTWVRLPLRAKGKLLGVLTLVSCQPGHFFGREELALATALASKIALAINNSILYFEAQKVAQSREDLIAIVSHDLTNPLLAMQMNLSLLLDRTTSFSEEGSFCKKHLEIALQSSRHMKHLIEDLLVVTELETGRLPVIRRFQNACEIIQEAREMIQPLARKKNVSVIADVPMVLAVTCDRKRLLQVFSNVIGNAIKFTAEGSEVVVHAGLRAGEVYFAVRDQGPGIPQDQLAKIFERSWRGAFSSSHRGNGLGLYISKGIVEAHGGRIWAESLEGSGTTLCFTIPVSE